MASTRTINTSLTILNGAGMFAPANGDPNWSPVEVAVIADSSAPAIPADNRIYVKPNTEEGYDNDAATKGTRSVKFAVGGSAIDTTAQTGSTANCILFQVKAPDGLEAPLNDKLPVVTALLSAEADAELGTEMDGIITMAPLIANIVAEDEANGLLTVAVTMAAPRTVKGIVVVEVNFGYSASN